jgi:hypothetical protein
MMRSIIIAFVVLTQCILPSNSFTVNTKHYNHHHRSIESTKNNRKDIIVSQLANNNNEEKNSLSSPSSSYDTSDSSSKGIVSSLTGVVNFVMGNKETNNENGEIHSIHTFDSYIRFIYSTLYFVNLCVAGED